MDAEVRLLQFSDPHLFEDERGELRGVRTLESLQRVLAHAQAHRRGAQAALCTGDIVNDEPGGYRHFERALGTLEMPVYCLPGNHDDPAELARALHRAPFQVGGHVDVGRWRIILLDSTVPGAAGGHLGAGELARLRAALQESDRFAMVCLHHQPMPLASRWIDHLGLDNADELLTLLDAHPQVRLLSFGHVHQCFEMRRGTMRVLGTPSTCVQFRPLSEQFALDDRPPAYRRLTLHADGTVDTEVVWVDSTARIATQEATGTRGLTSGVSSRSRAVASSSSSSR